MSNFWVGIGYKSGSSDFLEGAIEDIFNRHQIQPKKIIGLATIDSKAQDTALLKLCQKHNWLLQTFPAQKLKLVAVPNPSLNIAQLTGTPSVCEAAAILAAFNYSKNSPLLRVQKQIYRPGNERGMITIAISETIAKSAPN